MANATPISQPGQRPAETGRAPGELPEGINPVEPAAPEVVEDGTGLPSFGSVPSFALFDERGQPFTHENMLGEVWVVDFIFTRCAGICVPMSRAMVDMQEADLPAHYLSITVDPSNDSPDVLRGYREKWEGNPHRWRLLTGNDKIITGLSEGGFTLPVQTRRDTPVEGMPSIFHSGRFALVDREGRVRGFYNHDDRLEVETLHRDIRALADAGES